MPKRKAQDTGGNVTISSYFSREAPRKDSTLIPISPPSTTPKDAKSTSSTGSTSRETSVNSAKKLSKLPSGNSSKNPPQSSPANPPKNAPTAKTLSDSITETASKKSSGNAENKPSSSKSVSTTPPPSNPNTISIIEATGDLFAAPPNAILIHACNCEGSWGAGIAKAFRLKYPLAFSIYNSHCRSHKPSELVGTALLIPPQNKGPRHFVGCLFTSRSKGWNKDGRAKILSNTGPAMRGLLKQVSEYGENEGEDAEVGEVWMCRINSGLFDVPWEKTKEVLEDIQVEGGLTVTVMEKK